MKKNITKNNMYGVVKNGGHPGHNKISIKKMKLNFLILFLMKLCYPVIRYSYSFPTVSPISRPIDRTVIIVLIQISVHIYSKHLIRNRDNTFA